MFTFPSIDGKRFDAFFIFVAAVVEIFLTLLLIRFVLIWMALRQLLRRLYFHPTRGAYETLRLRSLATEDNKVRLFEPRPSLSATEFCLERARDIATLADNPQTFITSNTRNALAAEIRQAEKQLGETLTAEENADWKLAVAQRAALQEEMAKLADKIANIFEPVWRLRGHWPPTVLAIDQEEPKSVERKLLDQANLFVAARVVDFLRQVFPQLLNLVGFAMASVVAVVLAASAYPFPAHDTLLWISWTTLLSAVVVSISVFVGINRSRIVSMLYGTTPGRFNWDSAFTMHFLVFAVIPILTLLGAQFPHALGGIFSWIGGIFGGGKPNT